VRFLAAALLAAIACALAASASAQNLPPIGLGGITIVKLKPAHARSCSAQSHAKSTVGKASRKLKPVACEQPPRANTLNAGFGFFVRLRP
jgi:hypothetical protein